MHRLLRLHRLLMSLSLSMSEFVPVVDGASAANGKQLVIGGGQQGSLREPCRVRSPLARSAAASRSRHPAAAPPAAHSLPAIRRHPAGSVGQGTSQEPFSICEQLPRYTKHRDCDAFTVSCGPGMLPYLVAPPPLPWWRALYHSASAAAAASGPRPGMRRVRSVQLRVVVWLTLHSHRISRFVLHRTYHTVLGPKTACMWRAHRYAGTVTPRLSAPDDALPVRFRGSVLPTRKYNSSSRDSSDLNNSSEASGK